MLTGSLALCVGCTKGNSAECARSGNLFTALRRDGIRRYFDADVVHTCGWSDEFLSLPHTGGATYLRSEEVTPQIVHDNPLTTFLMSDRTGRVHGYRLADDDVMLETFGMRSDGSQSIHAAFVALSGSGVIFNIRGGTHLFDNSATRQIDEFFGKIRFAEGAKIIFTDSDKKGLYFFGGSPSVEGGDFSTRDRTGVRQLDAPIVYFNSCKSPSLRRSTIHHGSGAGVVFRWSDGATVENVRIADVLADGLDIFNCSDFAIDDVRTEATGDDGVAILDYRDGPRITGGKLGNIDVRDSGTRGITMIGPSNVTLDGFHVEDTQGSGLLIGEDASNGLRVPTGCSARNGAIINPGRRIRTRSYSGNRYGIEVATSGSVELTGIRLVNCATRGVDASSARPDAHLVTKDISVAGAEQEGFHILNQTAWTFDRIETHDTGSTGIYTAKVGRVIGGERRVVRSCGKEGPHRAVWDEANAYQDVRHTTIIDDRTPSRGYIYYARGTGRGQVGQFTWQVTGPFFYDAKVPNLQIIGHVPAEDNRLTGTSRLLDPRVAFRWQVDGRIEGARTLFLPDYGRFPGMRLTIWRGQESGDGVIHIVDPGRNNAVMTAVPSTGTKSVTLRWDAIGERWQVMAARD